MFEKSPGPWALMEAAAGPAFDWPRLVSGARDLLYRIARYQTRLPEACIAAIVELGDGDLLGALAQNDQALAEHPGLRERLAATGARQVAEVAMTRGFLRHGWDLRLRRLAMSRLTEPTGAYTSMERAGVVAPVAIVARKALNGAGEQLTVAERLRAMLTLRRLEGPDTPLPDWLPQVPADRIDVLEARVAAEEGTAGAIAELLDGFTDHLDLRDELDWAAVAAEVSFPGPASAGLAEVSFSGPVSARLAAETSFPGPVSAGLAAETSFSGPAWAGLAAETSFSGPASAALAARPDCPEDLRLALFLAEPAAVAPAVPVLTEAMALAPVPKSAARIVARRAAGDGLDPALLLERMRPAAAVLEAVRLDALAKLVEACLGADPGKWAWVRAKLTAFPGSVAELLESAGTAAWPKRAAMGRPAFVALLDHAPAETHLALLEHLDDRTVHDLFTQGTWRPEWVGRALADPRPALRLALASRLTLDAGSAERLATLDDPEVNGKLFRRTGTPHRLRMRLLDGRPFDPAAREQLLKLTAGWHGTDPLDCADLRLQRHILRHVRIRGRTAQFRLLLNLWHRHGPAAVTDLLEAKLDPATFSAAVITPTVRSRVRKVLAARDPAARIEELEAEIAFEESAAGQIALLRSDGVDFPKVYGETRLWHWDAILAEHRRSPLTGPALAGIGEARGCPAELAEAGRVMLRPWANAVEADLVAGRPVAEVLAGAGRRPSEPDDGWLFRIIRSGTVTWEQVLRHLEPASRPLTFIGGDSEPADRAALAALVGEICGGDVDAILLAIRLAPDFPGPVSELLQVAAAAGMRS